MSDDAGGRVEGRSPDGHIPSVAPIAAGSAVYYGSGAYRVYARDTATGEKLWYRQIGWLPSDPALAGGTVFVTGKTQLVALRDS